MSKLQVIENRDYDQSEQEAAAQKLERRLKLIDIYYRQLMSAPEGSAKLANALIRYANLILEEDEPDPSLAEARWVLVQAMCHKLATITPRLLMQVFPPEKTYDGDQWGAKDYFSTVRAVEEHGLDYPVGDNPIKGLLWNYMNHHIGDFVVSYLSCLSAVHRKTSGKGLFEAFAEEQGIPMYHVGTDASGQQYMVNSQTGEVTPVAKPKPNKPRWWQVIGGNQSSREVH